ncbi:MAG TPA: histone deacetylase family protein [Rhizomicrobium sp.]|jgi:acetoin utilization deacetylase AcuC-like enzyme
MSTGLFTHPDCLGHVTPPGHPERVERLTAVLAALEADEFRPLARREAPLADRADLVRAHDDGLVDRLLALEIGPGAFVQIDGDTVMSAGSVQAARRAAGAMTAAIDAVLSGPMGNAFCAVRPPGHHAERRAAMGFCLFNSVAIGALHARAHHGLTRIAVVDFDVHHGNGTQDIFFDDPDLFYASTHQSPLYPGTGYPEERGIAGNILNVPLRPGSGGIAFRAAFENAILPALDQFSPQLLLVSAGFDAHRADPLAQLELNESDFAWATQRLCEGASQWCEGRVVSTLEGGYDLAALAASTAAHVRVLMQNSNCRLAQS